MTVTSKIILQSPATRLKISQLARLVRILRTGYRLGLVGTSVVCLLVAVQLCYPRSITRPFATLDNQSVGHRSIPTLSQELAAQANTARTIQVGSNTYHVSPHKLGIAYDTKQITSQLSNYSWRQRLIPGSLLRPVKIQTSLTVNHYKLHAAALALATSNQQTPINPSVAKAASGFTVVPGKTGVVFNTSQLEQSLQTTIAHPHVAVSGTTVTPKVDESKLRAVTDEWNKRSAQPFTVNLAGKDYIAPPTVVRDWLTITPNAENGQIATAYDTAGIANWLRSALPLTLAPAVAGKTTIVDNNVLSNVPGQAGTRVNTSASAAGIADALNKNVMNAVATTETFTAPTQVSRSYSNTSAGLQAIINDWSKAHPSITLAVSLQELGGANRKASLNENQQFFSASIYKLYTTVHVTNQISIGHLDPAVEVVPGKSISTCLEQMIVISDNPCGTGLNQLSGAAGLSATLQSYGFNGTTYNPQVATTTADTSNLLIRLANGTLLPGNENAGLIDRMNRQIYRVAIPAGASGCQVADKVGFYGAYWHDAAIVTCPKTKYVLVIFTKNAKPENIRDLTATLNGKMNN